MNKGHINLRLDETLLKEIEALADSEHKDRTQVIAELLAAALHPAPDPGPNQPAPGRNVPMPDVLKVRIGEMEKRHVECEDEAAKRERMFWSMTLPPLAINAGYGAGLLGATGSVLLHFISTMIMLVEKERPQNRLFTAYQRAALEFAQIERVMTEEWQTGCAAGKDQKVLLAQIFAAQEKDEERLTKSLESAESYLKETTLGGRLRTKAAKTFAAFQTT